MSMTQDEHDIAEVQVTRSRAEFANQDEYDIAPVKVTRSSAKFDLGSLGDRYLQQFITFREIARMIEGPHSESQEVERLILKVSGLLNEQENRELQETLVDIANALASAGGFDMRDPETLQVIPNRHASAEETQVSIKSPEVAAIVNAIISRTLHHVFAPDKNEMVAQSLLVSVISAFGILMGSIAREAFKVNKTALEKSDFEFTLEELSKYDSIQEARNELVNRRVEALLGGGIDDWSIWCKRVLQLDLPALSSDWPKVREIFARRNIIVHNAGRVNHRYLSASQNAGVSLPSGIKVGDTLETGAAYIDDSVQRILALGLCLVYSTRRKLYPKESHAAAAWLVRRQETMVYDEMWMATHEIASCLNSVSMSRLNECFSKTYDWLARKKFDDTDSVRREVDDWDVSGLDVIFQIYKNCLLGNVDRAARLIASNRGKEYLTKYDIAVNPIFEEYRELASREAENATRQASEPPRSIDA
jgi:hypothetical protein